MSNTVLISQQLTVGETEPLVKRRLARDPPRDETKSPARTLDNATRRSDRMCCVLRTTLFHTQHQRNTPATAPSPRPCRTPRSTDSMTTGEMAPTVSGLPASLRGTL